jgi:biopolymer transport protein ExbD
MKRILEVRLVALTLEVSLGLALAGRPINGAGIQTQAKPPMQRGITVEMPATRNAASMPAADQESALIVAVTHDGTVYLGVRPIDPEGLSSELRDRSSAKEPCNTLYIKADARAPYATVIKVLDAATRAGIEETVLLTNQNDSPQPGTVSPPKGFTIMTGQCLAAHRPRLSL